MRKTKRKVEASPAPAPPVMGRPTKYRREYCQMLVEFMGEGYSFEAFAAKIRVNQDTVHEWAKVHADFSEAKKEAWAQNLLFYERVGILGMLGKSLGKGSRGFNTTAWIFNMKNRHRWHDGDRTQGDDPLKAIAEQFRKADEALKKRKKVEPESE